MHYGISGVAGISRPSGETVRPGADTDGGSEVFGSHWFCILTQGEPGYGVKGDKGDSGAPGPQVSDAESL